MLRVAALRCVRDERGTVSVFALMVFMLMFLSVGMGIDFMRHEAFRAELQNAVDRGVLAAASPTQTIDAEATVRGYMKTATFIDPAVDVKVSKTGPVDAVTVTASASYTVPTYFLRLVGIPDLRVAVTSTARRGLREVEMAFVLDVSESMTEEDTYYAEYAMLDRAAAFAGALPAGEDGGTVLPTRLETMRWIARDFIDEIYDQPHSDKVHVSIVPFAGAVNPGPTVFDTLVESRVHDKSHCLDLEVADFTTAALPIKETRPHLPEVQHSQWYSAVPDGMNWGMCPEDVSAVTYFQNDRDVLKSAISRLEANDGTATHHGMKWGVGLLDPRSRGLVSDLVLAGEASSSAKGLPFDYGSGESVKAIVLVTDGITRPEIRPRAGTYGSPESIEFYATPGFDHKLTLSGDGYERRQAGSSLIPPPNSTRADFRAVCDIAKANGIEIFTVGFNLDDLDDESVAVSRADQAKDDLEYCASTYKDIAGVTRRHAYVSSDADSLRAVLSTIQAKITRLRQTAG